MAEFFRRNTKRIGIGLVIVVALLFSAQASAAQAALTVDGGTFTRPGALITELSTKLASQSTHHSDCGFEFDDG